jgi:hypothetical protein
MAKSEKTKSEDSKSFVQKVPHTMKTIVAVGEIVARFLAAYLLFSNFDHVVALAIAWYLLITAVMAVIAFVHKANK